MSVGRLCTRTVWIASAEEDVAACARRMAEHDVGTLVVLDEERRPLGLLTDRDVVLRVVAKGLDPAATRVAEVMSRPVLHAHESTPIEDGIARMAGAHARRLVVTGDDGRLVGLLALDDVLDLLAEEAQTIGRLLQRSRRGGLGQRT
jgi:CBS domain-containing protein